MLDTHCHLTHRQFDADRDAVLGRAVDGGVSRCITIGTGVEDARKALELSRAHPELVSCTAGLDPFTAHAAGEGFDSALDELAALLREGGFVGLGEIGLDYHYDLDPKPVQRTRFEAQLRLSVELDLPVVIHVREAHADMVSVLSDHPDVRGVIHSFTGGPAEAERYLELDWYLAFNGVVTFKSAEAVREAIRLVPESRLLAETDSPYLAPVPHRGRRCEPAFVAETIQRMAEMRGVPASVIDAATTQNGACLFDLSPGA